MRGAKGEIARQSSSYRQGVILGLTMAEVMLLLVFCLLIALSAMLSKMNKERLRLEEKLRQASAEAKIGEDISRLLTQSPQLREAIERKLGTENAAEIDEFWRKLVESTTVVDNLERLGVSRTELIDTSNYIAEAEQLRKSGISLDKAKHNSELVRTLVSKFGDSKDASDSSIVSAFERGLAIRPSDDGHHWPPIIKLSEADGYYFDSGKADLTPEFVKSLRTVVPSEILKIASFYDIDVIEVVGHTDEQPLGQHTSNLDKELIGSLTINSSANKLQAADNAGLGLARAAAVVNVFLSDKRLSKYKILPLSGAQLIQTDETLANALSPGNVKERRRIEIRLRKSTPPQALGHFVSPEPSPVETNRLTNAPLPTSSKPLSQWPLTTLSRPATPKSNPSGN